MLFSFVDGALFGHRFNPEMEKNAKEGGQGSGGEHFDPLNILEVKFLRNLIEEFLEVVCHTYYLLIVFDKLLCNK